MSFSLCSICRVRHWSHTLHLLQLGWNAQQGRAFQSACSACPVCSRGWHTPDKGPAGSPRPRRALNPCPLSSAALRPLSCCLFVLGYSPLYTPTPLWEKSTFALPSLANRRGLCSILMAAQSLQGSHDKSSGICCWGDPLKHKSGSSVCV